MGCDTLGGCTGIPGGDAQDELCQRCGNTYPEVWYAHDGLWREVVGTPDDGKGLICPRCFNVMAGGLKIRWVAHREWPARRN